MLACSRQHRRAQFRGHEPLVLVRVITSYSIHYTKLYETAAVERLLAKEATLGEKLRFEDIVDEVAGVYPSVMLDGEVDAGPWSCGMVVGLIHDIPTWR